jgi:glycosyltransferase involved in cell wall biosynthesis
LIGRGVWRNIERCIEVLFRFFDMKKNPLVSTLICTYNAEKFISMTLDSVIGQTYKNQEILILDNGSKDNTVEIIKKYQEINVQIILFDLGKNL